MKKLLLAFLILICAISLNAQTIKQLDEKYGFRNAKFEMELNSFKNLVEYEPNWFHCLVEDSILTKVDSKDVILKSVSYRFYKNKLSNIVIRTSGLHNSYGLLHIIILAYGYPTIISDENENFWLGKLDRNYYWKGDNTYMTFQRSTTYNAELWICSKIMNEKEKQDEKDENLKSAKNAL